MCMCVPQHRQCTRSEVQIGCDLMYSMLLLCIAVCCMLMCNVCGRLQSVILMCALMFVCTYVCMYYVVFGGGVA